MPTIAVKGKVNHVRILTHPEVSIYQADLEGASGGSWSETYGSARDMENFLRGVQAGIQLAGGRFTMPEIPVAPSHKAELIFK